MLHIVLNENVNCPFSNISQPQTLILINLCLNLQLIDF